MDPRGAGMSGEAREVIAALILRMRDDDAERVRRWGEWSGTCRSLKERAQEGRLLVPSPHWETEVLLDAEGRVIVSIEAAGGSVERLANAREAHLAWQGYVPRHWPELVPFVPTRPADAVVCASCGGHGLHVESPANVSCVCANLGWFPPEAVDLPAFNDFALICGAEGTVPAHPAPSPTAQPFWQRVRGWLGAR